MTESKSREPVSRDRIVASAKILLRRYGARKLTLSDVARDLGVSHAALYRYFDGKPALDAAIVEDWIRESMARIDWAEANISNPAERLEQILVDMHMNKKKKISADPEVYQLYLVVLESNPPILQAYAARVRQAIGVALSEYMGLDDKRIAEAAEVLENAVFRFLHPVHTLESLHEDTERQLRTTIRAVCRAYEPTASGP